MSSNPNSARRPPTDAGAAPADRELADLLGPARRPVRRRWRPAAAVGLAVLAVLAAILAWNVWAPRPAPDYLTEPLTRGDLVATVAATGTLEPVNQVDVGSELSGTIEKVLVDDNDVVTRGQVLAVLDTARLRDQVALSEAAVAAAQANLEQVQATVRETTLKRDRVRRLWSGSDGGYPARADVDAAEAAADRAIAGAAAARAALRQAQATDRTNRTNLGKATIRSPISGVILDRQVEPGQTVAASLQAPVLFTLAEDLARMDLHVDVDEAEVAGVKAGQAATFTVDAHPGRTFPARVERVGLGSQTKEGVVTYTAVLSVENADMSLRPGMTATADITTDRRPGVLLVPEAALRYSPPQQARGQGGLIGALTPRMPRQGGQSRRDNGAQVWVLRDGEAVRTPVTAGATNGRLTEVRGAGLREGMAVIVGANGAAR